MKNLEGNSCVHLASGLIKACSDASAVHRVIQPPRRAGRAVLIKVCIQEETVSKKIKSFSFFNALNNVCIIVVRQAEITCQAVSKVAVTGLCASRNCTKGSSGCGKKRLELPYFLKHKNEK